MKFQETETVELKAVAQDGIKKEIVAFANSNGGTVYVGVGDDGTILGVEDADGCALQVSNMVRDAVRPDATMFVSYETLDCDGKAVVAVKVQRGTPTTWRRRACAPRASTFGRGTPPSRRPMRPSGR